MRNDLRKLMLASMALSVGAILVMLFAPPVVQDITVAVIVLLAVSSAYTMVQPAGRAVLAKTPNGVGDLVLSLALVCVLAMQGYSIAAGIYLAAVVTEIWARQFRFVLL